MYGYHLLCLYVSKNIPAVSTEVVSQEESEDKNTTVKDISIPAPEEDSKKEHNEPTATPVQQVTVETESDEGLQVAAEIQAGEEEEGAEEMTEEERMTQQLKATDDLVQISEEDGEEDEERDDEPETQCSSQKNNSDHQYFSGDFTKVQAKETDEKFNDREDDIDEMEEEEEEEEQEQVEPRHPLSTVATNFSAQVSEPDAMMNHGEKLDTHLSEDEEVEEEEEEFEEEREDASNKVSPTVVIELQSDDEDEVEEEEEDDGEDEGEEELDEAEDEEMDSVSHRSEVTDESETYDMTRGNLGLLEQAIALKAEQTARSSEESRSPEQLSYHSADERSSKMADTPRRGYYGKSTGGTANALYL